jgi:hypothetical protein
LKGPRSEQLVVKVSGPPLVCAFDGTRFGQALFGERPTIEILPGRYALRIHNTLVWKTAEFAAEPGERVHCTVWNHGWDEAHYLLIVFVGWSPLASGWRAGPRPTSGLVPEARAGA